jgi:lysine-N-methylase
MILRKPDFYDKFKCIAERCSDTCCVGWEIDIDKASQDAYRKVAGTFGDKLRENIEDGHFKLLPHDRCPFLTKDNLCEIYTHLGEGALCEICTEHPRFVEVYGDIMERGLGLCCEEATRLLLTGEGPLQFTACECDEIEDELSEDDIDIRNQVFYEREQIFSALADSTKPLADRFYVAFGYTPENPFAPLKNADAYLELLSKTESFGPAWDDALARIRNRIEASPSEQAAEIEDEGYFSENEGARLLAYLIYRHYAKCLFEGYEQGKRLFPLFFWNTVRFFARELAGECSPEQIKINAVKILSRQLEYCEENMTLIESTLDML